MKNAIKFKDYYKYATGDTKKLIDAELSTSEVDITDLEIKRLTNGQVESVDDAVHTSTGYASTRFIDFSGDVMIPEGINLAVYNSNPIVHYQHQTSAKPIGKAIDLEINEVGLKCSIQYATDATEEAASIYKLVLGKYLRQHSMGYIVLQSVYPGDNAWDVVNNDLMERYEEYDGKASRIIQRCLLLEISIVNIADNQSATVLEVKGLTDADLVNIKKLGISVEDGIDREIEIIEFKNIQPEDTDDITIISMPEVKSVTDRDIEIIETATKMGILIR